MSKAYSVFLVVSWNKLFSLLNEIGMIVTFLGMICRLPADPILTQNRRDYKYFPEESDGTEGAVIAFLVQM